MNSLNELPEKQPCDYCGLHFWRTELLRINVEHPSYSMRDPYPGYAGDLVCVTCRGDER